ncbi:recombinase family protein [Streptomyces sp. NPDC047971]|uniref:recombinase family protein n=1 Tax=Streptomyces sp. NPDC047971 TaxID=3154499 RepID=UPI0033D509FA
MIDTRNPARPSKTFSRSYVTPALRVWLAEGGDLETWLDGRTPLISYARISADRLDGEAIGVGRQHRNNIRSAERHDCVVVLHYEDNNITAAARDGGRRAFLQMCRDLSHGHEAETGIPVRGCVAVERERVYRLPRDFVAFQDALAMAGDGVFIEGDAFVDLSEAVATVVAAADTAGAGDAEMDKLRKRTMRNASDRAEEGKVYGGPRRFGWLGASKDPCRVGNKHADLEEFPHLIGMIEARCAGRSWRGITGDLNRAGVRTARGGRWTEQGVRGLVTNPAWWGGRVLDGGLVVDPITAEPVIGEWDHADEETHGVGYEAWKSIMAGVGAKRPLRGLRQVGNAPRSMEAMRGPSYLFSGVLRCGRINDAQEVCHAKLAGNRATGRNAKYGDYYRCGDANCRGIGRKVASVDAYLEGLMLAYLDERFAGTEADGTPWRGDAVLANLRRQRRDIQECVDSGGVDRSRARHRMARLDRNIAALEHEERDHLKAEARRNLLRGWTRAKWERMEPAERREVIAQVFRAVVVQPIPMGVSDKAPFDPGLLTITWRDGRVGRGRRDEAGA